MEQDTKIAQTIKDNSSKAQEVNTFGEFVKW